MELNSFQTFREVAFRRSFTRAAVELGYAQSSVTAQIQKLEKEYGVELFERFGRGVRLTSAGEDLLKIAVEMLDLYQRSKEQLSEQGGGTLSIGAIDSVASYFLPVYIQQLRLDYSNLRIQLLTGQEDEIVNKVREGELDIGLMLADHPTDITLEWTVIRDEPLVVIANPKHPLTKLKHVELSHLAGSEWFMSEESCNYRMMLEKVLRANKIDYRIGLELGNPEAIKRCVKVGEGIAILPYMAADEEIRRGELAILPFAHPEIRLDLQMVTHPKKWISHALADFTKRLHQKNLPISGG